MPAWTWRIGSTGSAHEWCRLHAFPLNYVLKIISEKTRSWMCMPGFVFSLVQPDLHNSPKSWLGKSKGVDLTLSAEGSKPNSDWKWGCFSGFSVDWSQDHCWLGTTSTALFSKGFKEFIFIWIWAKGQGGCWIGQWGSAFPINVKPADSRRL